MKPQTTAKAIKYLLFLQILIVLGIGICEIVQLVEIDMLQRPNIDHLEEWNHLIGYTSDAYLVITRIYYWIVIIISFGILGWLFESFEKRWKNIQDYDKSNSKHVLLFVLWFGAIIPSVIILLKSNGVKICTSDALSPILLSHCNAYLASVLLAYIFEFTIVIQLLFHFIVVKRQKQLVNPPPIIKEGPKLTRVRRSKRVSKRNSIRSSAAFSNGSRLSVVAEDEEERSVRSNNTSIRSATNNKDNEDNESMKIRENNENNSEYSNEKQIYSNV